MRVTQLKLANLRAIKAAEYRFPPECNLIAVAYRVGNTGVSGTPLACQAPRARASVSESQRRV